MFPKTKIHLVPQFLQDRASFMLRDASDLVDETARDNCAQQLEVVRDFCIDALGRYEKQRLYKGRKTA
jgi:hypothetical protein